MATMHINAGEHGEYLLIVVKKDAVELTYSEQHHGYLASLNPTDLAEVKAMVDADPRLGDRRPGVVYIDPHTGNPCRVMPLDYQQWRDIRGLTHNDP